MYRKKRLREVKINKESVFITGCDSGIGLYFAKYLASFGCVVFAGVLDYNSAGVKDLLDFKGKGEIKVSQLDVTDNIKIKNCLQESENLIHSKKLGK